MGSREACPRHLRRRLPTAQGRPERRQTSVIARPRHLPDIMRTRPCSANRYRQLACSRHGQSRQFTTVFSKGHRLNRRRSHFQPGVTATNADFGLVMGA